MIESRHNASQVVIRKLWERWHILYPLASSLPAGSRTWLHPIAWCKMKAPGISVHKLDTVPVTMSLFETFFQLFCPSRSMTGWLLFKGPFSYSRRGCELPVEPGTCTQELPSVQLCWANCWGKKPSCVLGGWQGQSRACGVRSGFLKKCRVFVVIFSTPVTAKGANRATPLATKSVWSFSCVHTHLRIVGALFLVPLLLSHKKPNFQLNRRMIALDFKYSYSLVPYALWHWKNVAW